MKKKDFFCLSIYDSFSFCRTVEFLDYCGVRSGKKQAVEMILEDGLEAGNSAFQCCVYMHAAHSSQRLLISFRKILLDTAGGTNGVISGKREREREREKRKEKKLGRRSNQLSSANVKSFNFTPLKITNSVHMET